MQQILMTHYNQYVRKAFLWHQHQQACEICSSGGKMINSCEEVFVNYKIAKRDYLEQIKEWIG